MRKLTKATQAKKDLFDARVKRFVDCGILYYDYNAGRYETHWHPFTYKRKTAFALDIYDNEFMIKYSDNTEVRYPYSKFDDDSLIYKVKK